MGKTMEGSVRKLLEFEGQTPEQSKKQEKTHSSKSFYLSFELQRRVRNAVLACASAPEYLTLSAFVVNGLEAELKRLRDTYNNGEEFPDPVAPGQKIRTGRPVRRD